MELMSYDLASASGLMVGFWFFLCLSAAIAFMIYALMSWPSVRRRELGLGVVRKTVAVPLALLIGVVIFAAIYLSSLAGFHSVTVGDDDVKLAYAVPSVVRQHALRGNRRRDTKAGLQIPVAAGGLHDDGAEI